MNHKDCHTPEPTTATYVIVCPPTDPKYECLPKIFSEKTIFFQK